MHSVVHRIGVHAWETKLNGGQSSATIREGCPVCGALREAWLGERYIHYITLRKAWHKATLVGDALAFATAAYDRTIAPNRPYPPDIPSFVRLRPRDEPAPPALEAPDAIPDVEDAPEGPRGSSLTMPAALFAFGAFVLLKRIFDASGRSKRDGTT